MPTESYRGRLLNRREDVYGLQGAYAVLELLSFFVFICLLISLAASSLALYRSNAAYSLAQQTLKLASDAIKLSTSDPLKLPSAVIPMQTISTSGFVTTAPAKALIPSIQLPKGIALRISYDPTCRDSSCIESFLSVRHCRGKHYVYWFRLGDGLEHWVENVEGQGCL